MQLNTLLGWDPLALTSTKPPFPSNCIWLPLYMPLSTVLLYLIISRYVLVYLAPSRFLKWRQKVAEILHLRRSSGADADADAGSADGNEDRPRTDTSLCAICYESKPEAVFTACGHMCLCCACASKVDRCPLCRIKSNAIRVYV